MVIWNSENCRVHQFLKYLQRMISTAVILNRNPCRLAVCGLHAQNSWAPALLAMSSHTEMKKIEGRSSRLQVKE